MIDLLIDRQYSLNVIPIAYLDRVYENTPGDSSLRILCVDSMTCRATITPNDRHTPTPSGAPCQWSKEWERKDVPKDFLFDLIFAQSQLRLGHTTVITIFKAKCADYYVKPRVATSKTPVSGQK